MLRLLLIKSQKWALKKFTLLTLDHQEEVVRRRAFLFDKKKRKTALTS